MAAEASSLPAGSAAPGHTMKLLCSHGGRLQPRGHDGAVRYAGGETRVLVVPRDVPFRELTRRLQEMTGGKAVLAITHRLADDDDGLEDVLVSITCDEELAHMRDEYDDLLATKPKARFRVFVTTAAAAAASGAGHRGRSSKPGLPPLPPKTRRAQSEQAPMHHRASYYPAPVRRVQSAQEFAGRLHAQQSFHHPQCCCCCHRRNMCAPAPPPPASPMNPVPYMSKKVAATTSPSMPVAKTTGRVVFTDVAREKTRTRDSQAAMEGRRTIWEFE